MTKFQTIQEENLTKDQIAKGSLNETPKPPAERATLGNPPTTKTPGLLLNQTIRTDIIQKVFYGTRLVIINPLDSATEIISDIRMDVRQLDEMLEGDDSSVGVMVEINGKMYLWQDGEYENDIIFDRKLVEKVFEKVDSQATETRIRRVACELEDKKKKLAMEMQELQKLEEELKWLQHEQKKQEPEDITDQLVEE